MGSRYETAAEPLIQASLLGEAIDTGPAAVFVADEQMRYVAVNAYAAELLGYERSELLGMSVTDVARSEGAAAEFAELTAGGERRGTTTLTRRDGSTVEFGYRATETHIAGMQMFISVGFPL